MAAKAKADAAVKNDAIKAQLARQLAERAQQEQAEQQEEMEYAQLEQVGSPASSGSHNATDSTCKRSRAPKAAHKRWGACNRGRGNICRTQVEEGWMGWAGV